MDRQMNMGTSGQQAQLGNVTVGVMTSPPDIITDKDLSYLKDALSWELLAMKKCSHWALNDILSTQKYLTDNYNIFVREASHEKLHQTVMGVFTRTNNCNRPACLVF
ncbi:spore coat protein [Capillibacterium thermochitinicola]